MNKTPLTELIEYLESIPNQSEDLQDIINKATSLLQKEKEQICDGFEDGYESGYDDAQGDGATYEDAEQYFNSKYNTNK